MSVFGERVRGVSSVVATVILVAIVVILASVGGALFFDIVDEATQPAPPQASFSYVQNGNAVTITHEGGESIPAAHLAVRAGGTKHSWSSIGSTGTVSAGKSAQFTVSGETDVEVLWTSEEVERSATIATRTIRAPATPTFSGQNRGIETGGSSAENYVGFGSKRLEAAGYSPEGHFRVVSSTNERQVRDTADAVLTDAPFTPADGVTYSFSLAYDGSTFKFTVDGQTIQTTAFSVEEDAIAVQVKNKDADVDTASVANLQVDGASIGSPDGFSTTTSQGARSLLLEDGDFDDGFTLTGEFTLSTSGSIANDAFSVRVDVA